MCRLPLGRCACVHGRDRVLVDQRREWQQRMQAVLYHHGAPARSWLLVVGPVSCLSHAVRTLPVYVQANGRAVRL